MVGTSLRIRIRTELGQAGSLIGDDQIYVIDTAHTFVIIFFIVWFRKLTSTINNVIKKCSATCRNFVSLNCSEEWVCALNLLNTLSCGYLHSEPFVLWIHGFGTYRELLYGGYVPRTY